VKIWSVTPTLYCKT